VAGFRAVQLLVLPAVTILTAAMIAVFTPRFAALAAARDLAAVRALVRRLIRIFGGLGLVLVALAPAAAWVLGAVVPQYAGSAGLIVPISVQAGLFMVNLALDAAVRGMGRVRFQLFLQLGVTAAIVVGVFVGGMTWGVGGAAWVIAACALAYLCGTSWNYRRGKAALSS
jgi:O-antigen/teichoic acid export membrane protein